VDISKEGFQVKLCYRISMSCWYKNLYQLPRRQIPDRSKNMYIHGLVTNLEFRQKNNKVKFKFKIGKIQTK